MICSPTLSSSSPPGTSAVYKLLDNITVINSAGHFSCADLDAIWSDSCYDGMHAHLLRLMMNFRLCYEIPGSRDHYIAPQLLSVNPPGVSMG